MDAQHERRHCDDRREFALYYRYGNERRDNTENRRLERAEEKQPDAREGVSQGYRGPSDGTVDMAKEIADAFGLEPDSLEMVEDDDHLNNTDHCPSCEDRAKKYAELEAELAESRKDAERYRSQVTDLLLSLNISRQ